MPSSVFRCISVFQVYFGVYTDPSVTVLTSLSSSHSQSLIDVTPPC